MINVRKIGDTVSFNVYVGLRASHTEIKGERQSCLYVRLQAPPVEGAANDELRALLARTFRISASRITIVSGHRMRTKRIEVRGVTAQQVEAIVAGSQNSASLETNG